MAERIFMLENTTATSTAAPVVQPTGAAIRTMVQMEVPAAPAGINILEWGISFDGYVAAAPVKCELFGCTGAATMSTATVAGDLVKFNHAGSASQIVIGGTTHTGFATAAVTEGTVANYRAFDLQLVAPTNQYWKQWPLGREPYCDVSTFVRVRVTAAATVNCYIYLVWSE